MHNTTVTVIELLDSTTEHEPHAWVEINMGGNTLTVRLDGEAPLPDGGNSFKVYLSAGRLDDEGSDTGHTLSIPYYQGA